MLSRHQRRLLGAKIELYYYSLHRHAHTHHTPHTDHAHQMNHFRQIIPSHACGPLGTFVEITTVRGMLTSMRCKAKMLRLVLRIGSTCELSQVGLGMWRAVY